MGKRKFSKHYVKIYHKHNEIKLIEVSNDKTFLSLDMEKEEVVFFETDKPIDSTIANLILRNHKNRTKYDDKLKKVVLYKDNEVYQLFDHEEVIKKLKVNCVYSHISFNYFHKMGLAFFEDKIKRFKYN